jgi:lipoprotein-anchoring transpeptidase ErfK/SrfK
MRRTGQQIEADNGTSKSLANWSSAAIIATLAAIILASIFLTNQALGQTVEPKPAQPTASAQQAQQSSPPQRKIVISVPHRKLAVMENGRAIKQYRVAVGASVSPSPNGSFRVVNRLTAPAYYHSGKVIPPGKNNPLGTRWIGLDRKSYGIHGTNEPKSIGKAASHGCIRMARPDLEELFAMVQVGDEVEIHGESDATVADLFGAAAVESDEAGSGNNN